MSQITNILIGGVIASFSSFVATFLATYLFEYLKENSIKKNSQRNLVIVLKLEFQTIKELLSKVKSTYEQSNYFSVPLLANISDQSSFLLNSRGAFISLEDEELQEKTIKLILDVKNFASSANAIENFNSDERQKLVEGSHSIFKSDKDLGAFTEGKRTQALVEMTDLRRQVDDILRELNKSRMR